MGAPESSIRGDVQGLRAVAVLLVLLGHAGLLGLTGGYVGVDVFFVISGFLITGIIVRDVDRHGTVRIGTFYARRARRILPAATVTLLLTGIASCLVYTTGHLLTALRDIGWAAVFAANVDYARAGTGYFATSDYTSPVQHFWSLAVEEQFYLLWPALVGVVALLAARRARRWALVAVAALSAASLGWSVWDTTHHAQSAYFSTFTRAWELGAGALLALTVHRLVRLGPRVRAGLTWIGLGAIATAALAYTDTTAFPGWAAALPVVGAALVLGGGAGSPRGSAALVLDRAPMRAVGDVSYSLYLVHWPLLVLPAAYVGHPLTTPQRLALVALALPLAWLSYRFVETPLRHPRVTRADQVARPHTARSLLMWPAAPALVVAVALGLGSYASASAAAPARTLTSSATSPAALRADVLAAGAAARAGEPLPAGLGVQLTSLGGDVTEPAAGCWADTAAATSHRLCAVGDVSSSRTIVAWGDSHLGMWLTPLSDLAGRAGYRLVVLAKSSCLPVDVGVWSDGRDYTECDAYRSWALRQIARLHPDKVVVAGYVAQDLVDRGTGRRVAARSGGTASREGSELFRDGALRTMERLRTLTDDVTVLSDDTVLPRHAASCLGSRAATLATCAQRVDPVAADRDASWAGAAALTGARYVDLLPWLCDDRTCPLVVGGRVVYRDQGHVTRTYATRLEPVLAALLRW